MLLNCDMGEGLGPSKMGDDAAIMPYIDMANIACGFHASDPHIINSTVGLAVQHNVRIGAHPGYADMPNFGRKHVEHTPLEITNLILYQVGALAAICSAHGATLHHIKPHGALYHAMMQDMHVYEAILKAVSYFPDVKLVITATHNPVFKERAKSYNVVVLFEAFADRTYQEDGSLVPRTQKNAVHHSCDKIIQNYTTITSGMHLAPTIDTLCIHGDNPVALEALQALHMIRNRT